MTTKQLKSSNGGVLRRNICCAPKENHLTNAYLPVGGLWGNTAPSYLWP